MHSTNSLWGQLRDGSWRKTWLELRWIWSYGKRYWKAILFYCFLGIFGTGFSLVSSIASKNIIDIVTGMQRDRLGTMIAVMIPMALFSLLFSSVCGRISLKINIRIQNDIQADIFDKILSVRWLELSGYAPGDLMNRFGSDVGTVAGSAIGWFPSLVNSLFSFLGTLLVVIYYDPAMGLITALNAPVMLIASRFTLKRMRQYTQRVKEINSDVAQFQQETFSNMDTVKSFALTQQFSQRLRYWQERYKQVNLEHNLFSIVTNALLSVLAMAIQYLAYFWCIYRLWTGRITYGEMTLFLSQGTKLAGHFKGLVSIIPSTLAATVSAGRIMEVVQLPREESRTEALRELQENGGQGYSAVFQNLSFGYVPDQPILENVNFLAQPGEIIGLAGPSGAGKTTCIRLLLGLVAPASGEAFLRDRAGRTATLDADTRTLFSYVPQGNTVFSGTVEENLKMVAPEASMEDMRRALEMACAWEFVEKMPQGIHSAIGQRGAGLSEGQAQRIAIARAVLRDAPVLLLDEATSALDPETERRILRNLLSGAPNKTCILTSHRPGTLALCRRVYRIGQGSMREEINSQPALL